MDIFRKATSNQHQVCWFQYCWDSPRNEKNELLLYMELT